MLCAMPGHECAQQSRETCPLPADTAVVTGSRPQDSSQHHHLALQASRQASRQGFCVAVICGRCQWDSHAACGGPRRRAHRQNWPVPLHAWCACPRTGTAAAPAQHSSTQHSTAGRMNHDGSRQLHRALYAAVCPLHTQQVGMQGVQLLLAQAVASLLLTFCWPQHSPARHRRPPRQTPRSCNSSSSTRQAAVIHSLQRGVWLCLAIAWPLL